MLGQQLVIQDVRLNHHVRPWLRIEKLRETQVFLSVENSIHFVYEALMTTFLKKLAKTGVTDDLTPLETKHIILLNALVIFYLIANLIFVPLRILNEPIFVFWLQNFVYLGLCASVLYLNKCYHYLFARLTFCMTVNVLIIYAAFKDNLQLDIHLFFFIVMTVAFFIFPDKEKKFQYFVILFALLSFIAFEIRAIFIPDLFQTTSLSDLFRIPNFLMMWIKLGLMTFLLGFLYYISRNYFKAESSLFSEMERSEAQRKKIASLNEEMTEDLMIAAEVQKHLFTFYKPPPFLRLEVQFLPHSHVSGDIYKLFSYEDDFNLFVGDSTGHGVAAALTTIMANVLLTQKGNPIDDAMFHINETLEAHLPDERFLTAVHVQIKPNGQLNSVFANHPPLLIIPASGKEPIILGQGSLMLGVMPNSMMQMEILHHTLKPGDKGFLYTDGITERMNQEGEMFGQERLINCLSKHRSLGLDSMISRLLEEINAFARGKKPDDDITVVAFEYIRTV